MKITNEEIAGRRAAALQEHDEWMERAIFGDNEPCDSHRVEIVRYVRPNGERVSDVFPCWYEDQQ